MKSLIFSLTILVVLITNVNGQKPTVSYDFPLKNATDSLSYSFGLLIGNNLVTQKVLNVNEEMFKMGFHDIYSGKDTTILGIEVANQIVQDFFNKQVSEEADMNLQNSAEFLIANAAKEGVVVLPSGLQYKIITPGTGEFPKATDQVKVNYAGTLIDGTVIESSFEKGEPVVFSLTDVIPGWTEALQLMQPGARWMLYIPPALAWGDRGAGGPIGPNMAVIFEIELIEIVKP